uniref:(northern house mosquito) hypothetical protein n=1 Tax=Culex pipiens TaxID=7175 RepID=A0A8D8IV40_CULPI
MPLPSSSGIDSSRNDICTSFTLHFTILFSLSTSSASNSFWWIFSCYASIRIKAIEFPFIHRTLSSSKVALSIHRIPLPHTLSGFSLYLLKISRTHARNDQPRPRLDEH